MRQAHRRVRPRNPGQHQGAPDHREGGGQGDGPLRMDRRARKGQREQQGDGSAEPQHPTHPAGQGDLGRAGQSVVARRRHQLAQFRHVHLHLSGAHDRPDRIISAAPPDTRRSSGRRRWRAAISAPQRGQRAPRRRAAITSPVWAPPRRIAERMAARTSRRRRSSSPVLSPPAGRRGSRRARQRISSASRLPTPDTTAWSMRRAFSGRGSAAHARAEVVAADLGGVGPQGGEVGLQPRAAETALVAQGEPTAVLEVHDEAVPAARGRLLVDRDAPGHAEVQPEHRPVARGLDPHRLAAAVRGGQLAADERVGDLAGRVRAAHVAVAVVDVDDAPEQRAALDRRARTLGLGQLRHPEQSPRTRGAGRHFCTALDAAQRRAGQRGALVVELEHAHRAGGRRVEAQAAEHALVEVLLDELRVRRPRRA